MRKLILTIFILITIPISSFASDIVHDWGVVSFNETDDVMIVDVRNILTNDKLGFSPWYAVAGVEKGSNNLVPEAKKYLNIIWAIPGVANMNYSSYRIQIAKGKAFTWAEIENKIYETLDSWYLEVMKVKE